MVAHLWYHGICSMHITDNLSEYSTGTADVASVADLNRINKYLKEFFSFQTLC